ncbi:hypothetical protein BH20VER3_BH20VER3_19060 [soil metagenome]
MHEIKQSAGNAGATGFEISAPRIAGTVPPKFRQALIESTLADAEWLRLPPPRGRCRLSGLSRTSLIELGERGAIKLIRVRRPGAMRGVVLVQKSSLTDFLNGLTPEGEKGGAK